MLKINVIGNLTSDFELRTKPNEELPYDVVCGTFFIVGTGEEDFKSLTDAQAKRYMDFYSKDMLVAIPPAPKKKKHKAQER